MKLRHKLILVFIIYYSISCVFISFIGYRFIDKPTDLEKAQDILDFMIPTNATNISSDIQITTYIFSVDISFDASPEDALYFANQICDNILYSGYDPFSAIPTGYPIDANIILVKEDKRSYYSAMSDPSPNVLGNRCLDQVGRSQSISVDKSNSQLYHIQYRNPVQREISSESYISPILQRQLGKNYVNPIKGLPFLLAGVAKTHFLDVYQLATSEICLEMGFIYDDPADIYSTYQYLVGGEIHISIDGHVDIKSRISERDWRGWRIVPIDEKTNDFKFNTCINRVWEKDSYEMEVMIMLPSGDTINASWLLLNDGNLLNPE